MKFFNIPETDQFKYELVFDGNKDDRRLHWEPLFAWYATDEETYKKIERMLDEFEIDRENYTVYMWYDVSGYDYWVNKMGENNYIQISVQFKESDIDKSKLDWLQKDLYDAVEYAESIEDKYFNPDEIPVFN